MPHERVAVAAAPRVTLAGLTEHMIPGLPSDSWTVPVNPFIGVMDIVEVPFDPAGVCTLGPLAATAKSVKVKVATVE